MHEVGVRFAAAVVRFPVLAKTTVPGVRKNGIPHVKRAGMAVRGDRQAVRPPGARVEAEMVDARVANDRDALPERTACACMVCVVGVRLRASSRRSTKFAVHRARRGARRRCRIAFDTPQHGKRQGVLRTVHVAIHPKCI